MIGVLVGDEDGGEAFRIDTRGGQPLERFLSAQPGIDEDAGVTG
jgi:hypothetical protein